MAEETIIADEQNEQVDVSDESEVVDSSEETTNVETVSIEDFNKLQAKLDKAEGRYKSTQKKIASEKKVQSNDIRSDSTDLRAVAEQVIAEFSEKEAFKAKYGEEIFADTIKIRQEHPTLSLEQAMKFSPIANDPARTANTEEYSNPWRANLNNDKIKTISSEKLSQLPQNEYNIISDKIDSWEILIED